MKQSTRTRLIIVLSLAAAVAVLYYVSGNLARGRAAAPKAVVTFSSGGSMRITAEQTTGSVDTNRISAFDLTFTATSGQITQIGAPATFPGGDTSIFTAVIAPSGLPSSTVHIVYVIQRPNAQLPLAIEIPLTRNGTGTFTLAAGATQEVVGYIPGGTQNIFDVVSDTTSYPSPTLGTNNTPGPTSPASEYIIEVESRGFMEFDIKKAGAPASTPVPEATSPPVDPATAHIRFAIVLESMQNFPEIEVRVKVTDLLAAITPSSGQPLDTCQQPGHAQHFYENVQMLADNNGIYSIKPGTPFYKGGVLYKTTFDGWLPLVDTHPGTAYAIAVKGPKHRSQRMVDTTLLQSGKHTSGNFNWSGIPLAPGDLPDPGSGNRQDCTVNALDLARIEGLLAVTDAASLAIADVNYDGVVNGNDISKVVNTLSTKPDDD